MAFRSPLEVLISFSNRRRAFSGSPLVRARTAGVDIRGAAWEGKAKEKEAKTSESKQMGRLVELEKH